MASMNLSFSLRPGQVMDSNLLGLGVVIPKAPDHSIIGKTTPAKQNQTCIFNQVANQWDG